MPAVITSITCIPMRLPFHHWTNPPLFAGRPRNKLDSALVKLETSDGIVGWGESYCVDPVALQAIFSTLISPLVVGKSAEDSTLLQNVQRTLHNLGRSGPVLHAIAGVDIALWDIRAKSAGVPLYELLGGKKRSRVRAYASLLQYYADPGLIRDNVGRAFDAGYREVKLHERTAAAVSAAREAMGPALPLMVDTNCAWTVAEAPAAFEQMAASNPLWIEEPLWPPEDYDALSALHDSTDIPIAVGENASSAFELSKVIDNASADYVQPSVIKLGLTATLTLSRKCEGTSVRCAPQVAFFGPGYLAALHLLASQATEASLERLFVELRHVPYAETVPIVDGWANVPTTPGLGADPEPPLADGTFSQ